MIFQQMSVNTAPIIPLRNSAPRLLRVFIRPPAKFWQSHASPVFEKSRVFLLRRNNPVYTRGPLGYLAKTLRGQLHLLFLWSVLNMH